MAQLWFKFWAKEYLADTKVRCLSYEQRGILQTLWAFAWEEGSIPADQAMLGNMLGLSPKAMRSHAAWIARFFVPDPKNVSNLVSPRLELDRMEADAKGSKARESVLRRWNKRNTNVSTNEPEANIQTQYPDPCVSHTGQGQGQEREKLPLTPSPPAPVSGSPADALPKPTKKRRSRSTVLAPFAPEVRTLANGLLELWPTNDPVDGREITTNASLLGQRLDEILRSNPELTPRHLQGAAAEYLATKARRWKAPQFFFGPGGNGESPPWIGYVRALLTRSEPDLVTHDS